MRGLLEQANRVRWIRRCNWFVARLLVSSSVAVLRSSPWVRSVHLRGSHGRGEAEPLASDVDLAIVVREDDGPRYESSRAVLARLRVARFVNPLLRDSWQLLTGDTEWPVFERYARIVGLDEWRGVDGRRPRFEAARVEEALRLAARWNRQHLWTRQAIRDGLFAGDRGIRAGLDFAAAEKKALQQAALLAGRPPPRTRREAPRTAESWLERAAALLDRLDESGGILSAFERSPLPRESSEILPDAPAAERILAEVSRSLDAESTFSRILVQSGFVLFVYRTAPSLDDLARLVRVGRALGRRCMPYSPAAFATALLVEESHAVAPRPMARPPAPRFLREQLFYEALFHGTELRALADRPTTTTTPLLTVKLARALIYFADGRLVRSGEEAVAIVAEREPGIGNLLAERPSTPESWFRVNAGLWTLLVDRLTGVEDQ